VTVHYVREGNEMVASRVVVRRVVQPAPTVVEKRSTDHDYDEEGPKRTTMTTTTRTS
jgi:hypothetical protein